MNTEHIDIGLARFSDWAFTGSVIVLVLALLLLSVELASSRGRKAEARELVGAGIAGSAGTVTADADRPGVVVDVPVLPLGSGSARPDLAWSIWASPCCWAASCYAAWPPAGCRGATCTSSST